MSSSAAELRLRVLRLYRSLMRAGMRTWPQLEERGYILSESRRLFRLNSGLEQTEAIERKLFEAQSRWELASFYGIAAPRYYYNQVGTVTKAANKSAINVRPAYLDTEYETLRRGEGGDERVGPRTRAAFESGAAAAAAAAAGRSARGAILSAVRPPSAAPTPPSLRQLPPEASSVAVPQPEPEPELPPEPAAPPGSEQGDRSGVGGAKRRTSALRKRRKPGTDRSRHRVPTHL